MKRDWIRNAMQLLLVFLGFHVGAAIAGDFHIDSSGFSAHDSVFAENVTDGFTVNFPKTKFEIYIHSEEFDFDNGSKGCFAEVGVRLKNSNVVPPDIDSSMRIWQPSSSNPSIDGVDLQRACVAHVLQTLMGDKIGDVWPPYAHANNAQFKVGDPPASATTVNPSQGRSQASDFTTQCNNMSCVRTYGDGSRVSFRACMNPASMLPMSNGKISNGVGDCSGTDSEGNFYGMGHVSGRD